METRKRSTSSGLFLMELILAILIFAIVSAVCVMFFVKSYRLSEDSKNLSFASREAANVGELVHAASSPEDFLDSLDTVYPESAGKDDEKQFFFDKNYKLCSETEAAFCMNVGLRYAQNEVAGVDMAAQIEIIKTADGSEIYSISAAHHIAGGSR